MKCSFTREGIFINSDGQHDAHVAIIGNGVEIALNDEQTYQGKSPCPLGLRIEADRCYVQVRQLDGSLQVHDVPLSAVHAAITNMLHCLKDRASLPESPLVIHPDAGRSSWKKGPLPPNTYDWGGVVTKDMKASIGFFLAGFNGDHAVTSDGTRVEAADVILYNNSIELPPST